MHKTLLWIIFSIILLIPALMVNGQQSPFLPVSYRVFNPFIFNPAVAGSKDFSLLDLSLSNKDRNNSFMGSYNMRLAKTKDHYVSSVAATEFTNIGVGGYIFREQIGNARNTGFGATASYHLPLDNDARSFISAGASLKAIYHEFEGDTELFLPDFNTLLPTADAGIYLYSPRFYAGISGTNLFFVTERSDSLALYTAPIKPMLFFHTGYKIIISNLHNVLIEPFVIVEYPYEKPAKTEEIIKPGIRLYVGQLSAGSFLNDLKHLSFFMQFKYEKACFGFYFEMPHKTAYFKEPVIAEISLGINLSAIKSGYQLNNHW